MKLKELFNYKMIMYLFLMLVTFLTLLSDTAIQKWKAFIIVGLLTGILGAFFYELHKWLAFYSAERDTFIEKAVAEKTAVMRNLLNNAGLGFLTFGEDLLIHSEYNSECIRFLGNSIESKKFSELIYEDIEQAKMYESMLLKILRMKRNDAREIYIPLLPSQVEINNLNIKIEYKIIHSMENNEKEKFFIVLTDITDKKLSENKMEQNTKELKMVVKIVSNYRAFFRLLSKYEHFSETGMAELLNREFSLEDVSYEIYKTIHNFKGDFGQLDMVNIVIGLSGFEAAISEFRDNIGNETLESFKTFLSGYRMSEWSEKDLIIIKKLLGKYFGELEASFLAQQEKVTG